MQKSFDGNSEAGEMRLETHIGCSEELISTLVSGYWDLDLDNIFSFCLLTIYLADNLS
jgi:hypothetical protein